MLGNGNSTIDIRVQVTINTTNSNSIPNLCSSASVGPPNNNGLSISNGNLNNANANNNPPSTFITPGTLSDLKKQRSLQYISRNNTFPSNGTTT